MENVPGVALRAVNKLENIPRSTGMGFKMGTGKKGEQGKDHQPLCWVGYSDGSTPNMNKGDAWGYLAALDPLGLGMLLPAGHFGIVSLTIAPGSGDGSFRIISPISQMRKLRHGALLARRRPQP